MNDRDMDTFGVEQLPRTDARPSGQHRKPPLYGVLAVYFGAVGINQIRHGLGCACWRIWPGHVDGIGVCYCLC